MAQNLTFADLRDKILVWLHGRRLGIRGDGAGPNAQSVLVLDGVPIGSSRSGPNPLKYITTGSNGAGAITTAGTKVGDEVELVQQLGSSPADASSSFETVVSVAGQIQQTSASNLSSTTFLFYVRPTQ